MNQKGFVAQIILVVIGIIILLVLGYTFLAKPYKVFGDNVIFPFKIGETVFAEKISYIFGKPVVGDRVIFTAIAGASDYIGIITKEENQNGVTVYTIRSTGKGQPWTVSVDKISRKIYYPALDQNEAKKIVESLNTPSVTPTPTPKTDETVNWKTYTNSDYGFELKHPDNFNVLDITNELVATGVTLRGGGDTKLKDFYKERYNKDVSILLTLIDPADTSFSSVVPKKVTSMWISGIRLEISPISKTLVQQTEEFVSDLKTFNRNDPDFKIEQSEMQVNNIRVNKITTKHNYFGAGVRNFSTAFFIKNNNLFTLTNESPGTGDLNKYFDQILSTFKFN